MINESAHLRIFALGILAHHHHIDLAWICQRRSHTVVENGRAHVRELIESAPDRQQQPVESNVIGDLRIADGSQQNRVHGPQLIECVGRHHPSIPEIVFGAPVEMVKVESSIEAGADCLQHQQRRRHYFFPYAIARDDSDFEGLHSPILGAWPAQWCRIMLPA